MAMKQYNRDFETTGNANTISQWVDAFNNNALAASDAVFMMGEATFSSVLYTGLETIGSGINAYKIEAYKDISEDFKAVYPDNLVLDNWYVYFRNINKFILISDLHVDLTDYNKYDNNEFVQGDLYHFFLNDKLGYRISHSPIPKEGEARLFRFVARSTSFSQLIPTFPRYFYSGDNTDYPDVTGMDVKPVSASEIGVNDGLVKYDGIHFDHHPVPDKKYYEERTAPGFTITALGQNYTYDDVIGTNDFSQNLRVTEVKNSFDTSNIWDSTRNYLVGEIIVYNGYWWTCRYDHQDSEPMLTSPNWLRGDIAGGVLDGELTTDPINVQLGGSGARVEVGDVSTAWTLMYNTPNNKLDYNVLTSAVDGSKIMDYTNNELTELAPNKFTIQRIHLDYLKDILVVQYGNEEFDTMKDALDAVYSLSFPFAYNTYIFPVLAYMVIKSDCTSLLDPDQCQIIQVHTHSTDIRESENLATDSYARSLIARQQKQIQALNVWLTSLQADFDILKSRFNLHISNNLETPPSIKQGSNQNPHRVTKAEVGLGNVDNVAMKDMRVPELGEVDMNTETGPEKSLVKVRVELEKTRQQCYNYTDEKTGWQDIKKNNFPETNMFDWVSNNFLYKTRHDHTRSGVITNINQLHTASWFMKFAIGSDHLYLRQKDNDFRWVAKDTAETLGVAWYVGELPYTKCQAYGVKRSQ